MEALYQMGHDADLTLRQGVARYWGSVNNGFNNYLYVLHNLHRIAEIAKEDYERRQKKLRPTDKDKAFTPILYTNEVMQTIVSSNALLQRMQQHKLDQRVNLDECGVVYREFAKTDEYCAYYQLEKHTIEDHRAILLALLKFTINHQLFADNLEYNFLHWFDDKSLVVGAAKKTIKALPEEPDFLTDYEPDHEATKDFGEGLLIFAYENDKRLMDLILPTLKNWDAERLAALDLIIIKLALSEFLEFDSIPPKVTLNEYVDIAKAYSTDNSKDFVNGILDRLMKDLEESGGLNKSGRGLIDE